MKRYNIPKYRLEDFMNSSDLSFDDMYVNSIYDFKGYTRYIKRLRYGINLFINK